MTVGLETPPISIVVIGRNEGERLVRCLESVRAVEYPADKIELVYVDTDSTDNSCAVAKRLGAYVVKIHPERPSAAAARNAGFRATMHDLVHFIDGDTVLNPSWLRKAAEAMDDRTVACVFGRCEEIAPTATVYNFFAHHDWYIPPGPAETCGGIALFRRSVFERAAGFDESLIAGEEPDLCCRIRCGHGLTILSLNEPMVRHDLNMTNFGQYWRRCVRTGHAYAQVGQRHPGMRSWRVARWRNLAHAVALPTALALSLAFRSRWPVVVWITLITLAVLRNGFRFRRRVGTLRGAFLYSLHHYVAKTPMTLGQCIFWLRSLLRCKPQPLIEHRR